MQCIYLILTLINNNGSSLLPADNTGSLLQYLTHKTMPIYETKKPESRILYCVVENIKRCVRL